MIHHYVNVIAASRRRTVASSFPQILSSSTYNTGATAATSFPVPMPSGITAGDFLLMILRYGGTPTSTITIPSGWSATGYNNATGLITCSKIADGSEGATQTVTATLLRRAVAACYRMSGASNGQGSSSNTNTNTMPALTPSGGSKKYLWLAVFSDQNNDFVLTLDAASSGFTTLHYLETTNGAGAGNAADAQLMIASQELEAPTLTPSNWTTTGTLAFCRKATIAISPP